MTQNQVAESAESADVRAWTIVADPSTGMVFESRALWRDAATAYRERPEHFRPLTPELASVSTHDGCTVGENAAYLYPGEYMQSDGTVIEIG